MALITDPIEEEEDNYIKAQTVLLMVLIATTTTTLPTVYETHAHFQESSERQDAKTAHATRKLQSVG